MPKILLKSLSKILLDENKSIKFLFDKNIIQKPRCQICNIEISKYRLKLYKCKNCQKTLSIYKNTIFDNSKIKSSDILLIAYFLLNKINYSSISYMTSYSSITIEKYINIFRELMINSLQEDDFLLGEDRIICEADESLFNNFWVMGIVKRTKEKKCYFEIVKDRNTSTLRQIIKDYIKPKSIVFTDC